MTYLLPFDLVDEHERAGLESVAHGARASGTPWISHFAPDEIVAIARETGFVEARYISTVELTESHLGTQPDAPRATSGEGVLLART